MPKTYLRFEPDDIYNVITAAPGAFFDKTGNFLISPSFSEIRIFKYPAMSLLYTEYLKQETPIVASFFHEELNCVALGYRSGFVQFVSLDSREVLAEFDCGSCITYAQSTPIGGLFCTSDGSVLVLDCVGETIAYRFEKAETGYCTCACVLGALVISGGRDRVVNVLRGQEKVQVVTDFKGILVDLRVVNGYLLVTTEEGMFFYREESGELTVCSQLEVETAEQIKSIYEAFGHLYVLTSHTIQQFSVTTKFEQNAPQRMLKSSNFYKTQTRILRIAEHKNGSILVSTGRNALTVLNPDFSPENEIDQMGHRFAPTTLALDESDILLLSAAPGELKIWNIKKSACILTVELFEGSYPTCALFLPGNAYALVGTKQGVLLTINLLEAECVEMTQIAESSITALELQGSALFTASEDCKVKFFTFTAQMEVIEERQYSFPLPVKTALLSEKYIFAALSDNTVRVHFADSLKYRFTLYGHALAVSQMHVSPNQEKLFTVSPDKTLRAWGLAFGECLRIIKLDSGCVCFSLLGETNQALVGCDDGHVRLFDLDSYEYVLELGEGHHGDDYSRGHFGEVICLVAGKQGRFGISAGTDGRLHLWVQTQDLVSAADEYEKRMLRESEREALGRHEWEGQEAPHLGQLDLLEETIDVCADPEENKAELAGESVGEYLMDTLRSRLRKETLPVLIENLTFDRALKLARTMLTVVGQYRNDFTVFVLLRLWRNQLEPMQHDERVAGIRGELASAGLEICNEIISEIDTVAGCIRASIGDFA